MFSYIGTSDEVQIPEGIKIIYDDAFKNNNLKKLILSESVTTIKRAAFEGCKLLEEVVFNKKLSKLDNIVFGGCTSLKNIDLSNTSLKTVGNVFRHCSGIETVILPKTLEVLGSNDFPGESLKFIIAPKDVVGINYDASNLSSKITETYIPAGELIQVNTDKERWYYFSKE